MANIFRADVAAGFPYPGVKTVPRKTGIKIVHNKLLGGWFVVRGPHHTPLGGRFDTRAEAKAWLDGRQKAREVTAFTKADGHAGCKFATLETALDYIIKGA